MYLRRKEKKRNISGELYGVMRVTIRFNFSGQVDREIQDDRPDIIVKYNVENTSLLLDFAAPTCQKIQRKKERSHI